MAWTEQTQLTSGIWSNWSSSWNNGTDQWGASNMTQHNHRYTRVGGVVYAVGSLAFASNSNFGTGTAGWTLWLGENFLFIDSADGGRIIGEGVVSGGTENSRALHFTLQMVNTFDVFAVPVPIQAVDPSHSGNYNAGCDNIVQFNRSLLQWVSNGGPVKMNYQLRFITKPLAHS